MCTLHVHLVFIQSDSLDDSTSRALCRDVNIWLLILHQIGGLELVVRVSLVNRGLLANGRWTLLMEQCGIFVANLNCLECTTTVGIVVVILCLILPLFYRNSWLMNSIV